MCFYTDYTRFSAAKYMQQENWQTTKAKLEQNNKLDNDVLFEEGATKTWTKYSEDCRNEQKWGKNALIILALVVGMIGLGILAGGLGSCIGASLSSGFEIGKYIGIAGSSVGLVVTMTSILAGSLLYRFIQPRPPELYYSDSTIKLDTYHLLRNGKLAQVYDELYIPKPRENDIPPHLSDQLVVCGILPKNQLDEFNDIMEQFKSLRNDMINHHDKGMKWPVFQLNCSEANSPTKAPNIHDLEKRWAKFQNELILV